ncbi:MAG: c-type cytochrome [Actinomycetota bacterium]|nr:c-type cytochrome [Actinomycetota bacterium]
MRWGVLLLFLFVLAFPAYRILEPERRAQALEVYQIGLVGQGQDVYEESCSQCHGIDASGGLGPALNSQQFLGAVDDRQMADLIATGSPGTLMAPYAADFGGSLTTAQIGATVAYLRSYEEDAPDIPEWRTPLAQEDLTGSELFIMGCAYCHGPNLEGTELAPDLGPGSEAEEESDSRLAKRITEGEDEMPSYGNILSEEQIELLVGYIREVQEGG